LQALRRKLLKYSIGMALSFSLRNRSPRELGLLAALAGLAALLWLGVEIADEVGEGDMLDLDRQLLLSLRNPADRADPIGPVWLEEMVRDLTALGSAGVLLLVVASGVGYFLIARKWRTTLFVLVSTAGGMALGMTLKSVFGRARPDLVVHGARVFSESFPSGHAMQSTVTYLTLAVLVARSLSDWKARVYVIAIAVFVSIVVGLTRVYLGVHWPTDVLAGWVFGGVWSLLCGAVAYKLQRRRTLEPPQG
jgi:undecaprenyl-diphosphatase